MGKYPKAAHREAKGAAAASVFHPLLGRQWGESDWDIFVTVPKPSSFPEQKTGSSKMAREEGEAGGRVARKESPAALNRAERHSWQKPPADRAGGHCHGRTSRANCQSFWIVLAGQH